MTSLRHAPVPGAALVLAAVAGCSESVQVPPAAAGTPCDDDAQCGPPEFLCRGGLCARNTCTTDAECPGSSCDLSRGTCTAAPAPDGGGVDGGSPGACASRYDCPAGQVCRGAPRACVDPPDTCGSDADCPRGKLCSFSRRCEPGCTPGLNGAPSPDCDAPLLCDPARFVCASCSSENPCPAGRFCTDGACVESRCDDDDGCAGTTAPHCDTATGTCVVCLRDDQCPRDRACRDRQCVAAGCDPSCPCGCAGGACAPQVCTPNSRRCAGTVPRTCLADGCGWADGSACACGCVDGACTASACTPGARRCRGDTPQTCRADGCAWVDEPSCPCGCAGGACRSTCDPGARRCSGDVLRTCESDGCAWSSGTTCSCGCADDACGSVCSPGSLRCDGNVVRSCTSDGCGWTGGTSCACGCSEGACATVCTPGARRCSGNTVRTCNADGCGWTDATTCPCGCSNGACTTACSPGTRQCSGGTLRTCAPDGCGWTSRSCGCGCSGGACTTVCTPGRRRCEGSASVACSADGCTWGNGTSCAYGCDAASGNCNVPFSGTLVVGCNQNGCNSAGTAPFRVDSVVSTVIGGGCGGGAMRYDTTYSYSVRACWTWDAPIVSFTSISHRVAWNASGLGVCAGLRSKLAYRVNGSSTDRWEAAADCSNTSTTGAGLGTTGTQCVQLVNDGIQGCWFQDDVEVRSVTIDVRGIRRP